MTARLSALTIGESVFGTARSVVHMASRVGSVAPVLGVMLAAVCNSASADSVLTLRSDFIEQFKNRVTIDAEYIVDKAHRHPNPPEKDADMHVAGRSDQIGLPTVAEIENAAEVPDAMDLVHSVEGTTTPLKLTGVWRIWPEHGGDHQQVQFEPIAKITTTNPPHVFEVHPVTKINGVSLVDKLHPINGFETKNADEAFQAYERTKATILPARDHSTVTITMQMAGFNYTEFLMRLNKREAAVADGEFVFGTILDKDGELLVHNRRIAFVKGSPPDLVQQSMQPGDCIHLVGIPRMDLALVSWRVAHSLDRPEVLTWSMPYEIVAVGVYGDSDTIRETCRE